MPETGPSVSVLISSCMIATPATAAGVSGLWQWHAPQLCSKVDHRVVVDNTEGYFRGHHLGRAHGGASVRCLDDREPTVIVQITEMVAVREDCSTPLKPAQLADHGAVSGSAQKNHRSPSRHSLLPVRSVVLAPTGGQSARTGLHGRIRKHNSEYCGTSCFQLGWIRRGVADGADIRE